MKEEPFAPVSRYTYILFYQANTRTGRIRYRY